MARLNQEGVFTRRSSQQRWQRGPLYGITASALLVLLLVLLNAIIWRFPLRWDISGRSYGVSARGAEALESLREPLTIDCVLMSDNPLFEAVRALLVGYRDHAVMVGGAPVEVRFIDPRRDLRAVEALLPYLAEAEEAILLRYGDERRRILPSELVESRVTLRGSEWRSEWSGFRGDAVLGAALWSLVNTEPRHVYALVGHGEFEFSDYHARQGYSDIARMLRRLGYSVFPLNLATAGQVPPDCSVLVLAGPRHTLTQSERDALQRYLQTGGRLLALLDVGRDVGIDPLLAAWGVQRIPAVAIGRTATGHDLVVTHYGDHPITRPLRNTLTLFRRPGVLAPLEGTDGAGGGAARDYPQVSLLAGVGPDGWIEFLPRVGSPDTYAEDMASGPAAVALAVERGLDASDVHVRPTRLVVIGDAGFAGNEMLRRGVAGNRDLFLNAIGWLAEDHSPSEASQSEPTLLVGLSRRGWRLAMLGAGLVWPAMWAFAGLLIVLRRRRSIA